MVEGFSGPGDGRLGSADVALGGGATVGMGFRRVDYATCLDKRANSRRIRIRSQHPDRDQPRAKRQGVGHAGQQMVQTAMIGRIQPGYGVVTLGGGQSSGKSVADIVNAIL